MNAHGRIGVVACGALALHVRRIAVRRGFAVDVHPLPPALHNHPERIAPAVAELLDRLSARYDRLAVAYAACGTGDDLDAVLAERGVFRLNGNTCYEVFALEGFKEAMEEEPGTYFLTDFLARTFDASVIRPLGLDRYPELRDDYFRGYSRVLWLAQRPTPELAAAAERAAEVLGLRLTIRVVGEGGLERGLERLVADPSQVPQPPPLALEEAC